MPNATKIFIRKQQYIDSEIYNIDFSPSPCTPLLYPTGDTLWTYHGFPLSFQAFPGVMMFTDTVAQGDARPRLGIVGEGQLARMLALSAIPLGVEVQILGRGQGSAMSLATHALTGDGNELSSLLRLAAQSDVVTLENEFIDAEILSELEEAGHILLPSAASVSLIQDKLVQKQRLVQAGLPVAPFQAVDSPQQLRRFGDEQGWPVVLKARRNGYDGKGNVTVRGRDAVDLAWRKLAGTVLYVEACCAFRSELAMVITVARRGDIVCYPLVESIQRHHICRMVRAPAEVSPRIAALALDLARESVSSMSVVGSVGVEMFLMPDDTILINELAPRVHNSGHYTLEACYCSQFENHVRAVMGWPLGDPAMRCPVAVMVNLLGRQTGSGYQPAWIEALAEPGVYLHDYGKMQSRFGRKMGHLTVLGEDRVEVEERTLRARALLGDTEAI